MFPTEKGHASSQTAAASHDPSSSSIKIAAAVVIAIEALSLLGLAFAELQFGLVSSFYAAYPLLTTLAMGLTIASMGIAITIYLYNHLLEPSSSSDTKDTSLPSSSSVAANSDSSNPSQSISSATATSKPSPSAVIASSSDSFSSSASSSSESSSSSLSREIDLSSVSGSKDLPHSSAKSSSVSLVEKAQEDGQEVKKKSISEIASEVAAFRKRLNTLQADKMLASEILYRDPDFMNNADDKATPTFAPEDVAGQEIVSIQEKLKPLEKMLEDADKEEIANRIAELKPQIKSLEEQLTAMSGQQVSLVQKMMEEEDISFSNVNITTYLSFREDDVNNVLGFFKSQAGAPAVKASHDPSYVYVDKDEHQTDKVKPTTQEKHQHQAYITYQAFGKSLEDLESKRERLQGELDVLEDLTKV